MPEQKKAAVNSAAPRATGHICMICGFIPSTKNKYRELQDHLVRKHFNDRIKAALPTKRPYMCPEPSCTIEGKDWQALMRHFTGKHGVLERYLREIIDAGVDEPADPKLRKVSTKSRLNPNGTAPAIQLPPEQIEQMERQALALSAEERMILQGGDGALATVLQTATAPPLPNHKIQGGHKMPRRKRPSRNSTGSISSPESLQDEEDGAGGGGGGGIAMGMSGFGDNNASGGGSMLFHDPPIPSELEEKEQPQLALVFKRPKSDPNGEDAYAFIDLQSFLASTTYIRNPADLVAKAANENVRLGVLATPLSPPPEQDEFELTKTEKESDVKPILIPSQPEPPQQQQVQSNAQADTRVVFSSQQQQQQQQQFQPPLPPPITSPPAVPGGASVQMPPATATPSTATAAAMEQASASAIVASQGAVGQAMSSSAPVLQQVQQQQQVDQPQTITVFNSVPVVDQAQPHFQDLQLDQHHQIVIPPTQEIPPHVEQQMLQAVQQQQQQQQQTYVIQQAVDLEQSQQATLAGGTVLYAQQQMPLAATEQFSLAGNETIVISQEQLEQMLGPVYLDNQTVQVFNPSTVQLPTEPVQIQVEGATDSTGIGLQQEQQLQPQQQVHNQGGQRVVVEQVGSLPIEVATSTSDQTERPSREVHESATKVDGQSAAANATVASNKEDNLQDVKEIDFSMF